MMQVTTASLPVRNSSPCGQPYLLVTGKPRHPNCRKAMRYFFHIVDGPTVFPDEDENRLSSPEEINPRDIPSCSVAVFRSIIAVREFRSCERKYSDM